MKTLAIFVYAILLPFLTYHPHHPSYDQASSDDEVYEVYSTAIKELYLNKGERVKSGGTDSGVEQLVVIRDRTLSATGDLADASQGVSVCRRISGITVDSEIIQDFDRKSKDSIPLEPRFKLAAKQVLISDEEFFGFLSGTSDNWPEFYKRYPASVGYVSLSPVGFSQDHNQHYCTSQDSVAAYAEKAIVCCWTRMEVPGPSS